MPGRTVQRGSSGRQALRPRLGRGRRRRTKPGGHAPRAACRPSFPLQKPAKKGAAPPDGAALFCLYSPAIKYREYPPSCMTSVGSAEPSCRVVTLTAAGPLCSPTVTV